jgi:hypothetical protein
MKHYLGQRYPEVRAGLTTPSLLERSTACTKDTRMVYLLTILPSPIVAALSRERGAGCG